MPRQKYTIIIERPIMVGYHSCAGDLAKDARAHRTQVRHLLKMTSVRRKARLVKDRNPSRRTAAVRVVTRIKDEETAIKLHQFLRKHSHPDAGVRLMPGVHSKQDLEPAVWRTRSTVLRTPSPTMPIPQPF